MCKKQTVYHASLGHQRRRRKRNTETKLIMENKNDLDLACTCGLDSQNTVYEDNGDMEVKNTTNNIKISDIETSVELSDIKAKEKSDVDTDSLESLPLSSPLSSETNQTDPSCIFNNSLMLNGVTEHEQSLKSPSTDSVVSDVLYNSVKPLHNSVPGSKPKQPSDKSAPKLGDKKFPKKISRTQTLDLSLVKSKTNSNFGKHKDLNKCLSPSDRRKSTSAIIQTSSESHGIRETRLSRTRFEKCHEMHDRLECEGEDYLTPTQRKELLVKNLKKEVSELKRLLSEKTQELETQRQNFEKELEIALAEKGTEIVILKSEIETLEKKNEDLQKSYQVSINTVNMLEENIRELKELIATRERNNEKVFLETYKKGQMSALFERNQELERMAVSCDGSSLTIKELLQKLLLTETELGKWQSIRRQESYDSATKPETEAEATLRFLKDSFFHYATDSKDCDFHLRAIIRILNFTDVQKKKIADCIVAKRKNKHPI